MPQPANVPLVSQGRFRPKKFRIPLDNSGEAYFAPSSDYCPIAIRKKILVYAVPHFRLIRSLECCEGKFFIWDLLGGECRHKLSEEYLFTVGPELGIVEENGMLTAAWPRNPLLVTTRAGTQNIIRIWSLGENIPKADGAGTDGKLPLLREIDYYDYLFTAAAAKGRFAVTGGINGLVRLLDLSIGEYMWIFIGHTSTVRAVDIDSRQVYSGSSEGTMRIWDIQIRGCHHILQCYTSIIMKITISPSHLVSSDRKGTICVWDPISGELDYQIERMASDYLDPFRLQAHRILFKWNGSLELRDIRSDTLLREIHLDSPDAVPIDFQFQGRFCIAHLMDESRSWFDVWEIEMEDSSEEGSKREGSQSVGYW